MTRLSICLLPLLLALPMQAQEDAPKTTAAGPVLVLKTSDVSLARMAARRAFDHQQALPEPSANGHYVLSLGADKKLSVTTGDGEVGLLSLTCEPQALMDLYAPEIEDAKPLVRGAMTMAMQQGGFQAKEAVALFDDVFAFPRQLARVTVKVTGDPEALGDEAMGVVVDIEGAAGSTFASIVEKLEPGSQGVPSLGAGGGMMDFQLSLTPDSMAALFEPMRELTLGFMANGAADRQRAMELYDRWIGLYDGGISMALDERSHMRMLMGVLDADALRELLRSEQYLDVMRNKRMPTRDMEIEVTPDAIEHRGIKVLRSRITGAEPNPVMPDGTMESHIGAVGNYVVLGGDEANITALIDRVMDQKIVRAPLAGGAMLHLVCDLQAFIAMGMAQSGTSQPLPEGGPTKCTVVVTRTGKTLRFVTHVQ